MAQVALAVFVVALSSAIAGAQEIGQLSGEPQRDRSTAIVGSALTCSSQPSTLRVPGAILERAKVKARLANLLRESLYDDAKGIVNIAREKEIRKLASKLKSDRTD